MTALILKIIALIAMLLDHIGYAFIITYPYRVIGRIAFPLYAFLLTEGYIYTKNMSKYISRIIVFALISQIPYNLFSVGSAFNFNSLNIFFTLAIGLMAMFLLDSIKKANLNKFINIFISTFIVFTACLVADLLKTDYGYYGILTILCFKYLKKNNLTLITGHFLVILSFVVLNKFTEWSVIQFCALLSLIPIILYNGKKGFSFKNPLLTKSMQLTFYWFYPLHLFILYLISASL